MWGSHCKPSRSLKIGHLVAKKSVVLLEVWVVLLIVCLVWLNTQWISWLNEGFHSLCSSRGFHATLCWFFFFVFVSMLDLLLCLYIPSLKAHPSFTFWFIFNGLMVCFLSQERGENRNLCKPRALGRWWVVWLVTQCLDDCIAVVVWLFWRRVISYINFASIK